MTTVKILLLILKIYGQEEIKGAKLKKVRLGGFGSVVAVGVGEAPGIGVLVGIGVICGSIVGITIPVGVTEGVTKEVGVSPGF